MHLLGQFFVPLTLLFGRSFVLDSLYTPLKQHQSRPDYDTMTGVTYLSLFFSLVLELLLMCLGDCKLLLFCCPLGICSLTCVWSEGFPVVVPLLAYIKISQDFRWYWRICLPFFFMPATCATTALGFDMTAVDMIILYYQDFFKRSSKLSGQFSRRTISHLQR